MSIKTEPMTREEFKAEVDEFVSMYCVDYFTDDKASWEFTDDDPDSFTAVIHLEAFCDRKYDLPICMDGNEVCIDLGVHDCAPVTLEPAEMFAWLWNEESKRADELEQQLDRRTKDLEEIRDDLRLLREKQSCTE